MISNAASQQSLSTCPYLGTEAGNSRLGEAVEYPSFENRCWTTTRPIPLLLTDQATLCLCNAYLHCPRFLAARAARQGQERPATVQPPADNDSITSAIKELEADVQAAAIAQTKSRRRWGWIGAGLIFMSSILCGGLFAAYVGWQMVRSDTVATSPGEVNTLAAPAQTQTNQQPQTFIFVTATSEPQAAIAQAPSQANPQPAVNSQGGPTPIYPQAVQPTPVPAGAESQQPPPSLSDIAQETNATASLPSNLPDLAANEPAPTLNFDLQIPTRRPTPVLDIPTSTPATVETPTPQPTATPAPPLGTPSVIFYVDEDVIEPDECTTVFWRVENVKEVYYENIGVNGAGQQEECVSDDHGDYNLMVVFANGATQWYTVTVDVIAPTNTPAPTPTKTQEPEPTATWTPDVPTDTPTPTILYGVRLEAGGDTKIECERGSTCELDFYASNTGSAIDNITVRFTEASSWPHHLCRLDGVCSESQMTLADMGFTATGVVRLRVTIPEDAASETMRYKIQAVSDKSGGSATSGSITVEVTAVDPPSEQSSEEGSE
jgi:hypothetical protein